MNGKNQMILNDLAYKCKRDILELSKKGCFIGSAYSCIDIMVYLYKKYLNINKDNINTDDRDRFYLSKGHAVVGLYALFKNLGWIDIDLQREYMKCNSNIYLHPNISIDGIEFYSGSLGHMLSVGIGTAIDFKLKNISNKVVVLIGDGELDEGTIWESLLIANAKKLDNLLVIVDRNNYQANYKTEKLIPLESLESKFLGFGCEVRNMDGHSYGAMDKVMTSFPFKKERVSVIVANTIRGKGIKSMENNWEKWFVTLNDTEYLSARKELDDTYNTLYKEEL